MRNRSLRVALVWGTAALLALLGVAGLWGGSAGAQQDPDGPALTVDRVDARGDELVVDGTLVGASPDGIRARIGDTRVDPTSPQRPPVDVVAVIDNGERAGNGAVQLAVDGLAPLMPGSDGVSSLTVLTTAGRVQRLGPWTDPAEAEADLERIVPLSGPDLIWDAVERAGEVLEGSDSGAVVLVQTGLDSSSASASAAAARLRAAGASLRVVALGGTDLDAATNAVAATGGSMSLAANDAQVTRRLADVAAEVAGRFRLALPADSVGGLDRARAGVMTLSVGGTDVEARFAPGKVLAGSDELAVGDAPPPGLVERFTANGLLVGVVALIGVVAVIVAVWMLISLVVPDENRLSRRLQAYEEVQPQTLEAEEDQHHGGIATVGLLKRAVDLTGEVAQRRGMLERLEVKLERANLPLRAAEALFFVAAGSLLLGFLALAVTRNPLVALLAVPLAVVVPQALLNMRIRRRQKAFVAQLPDMLSLMAGTLRAGYSIGQGFEAVSTEIDDPMGRELRRVVSENRLGRPLDEALDAVADRMGSDDFAWAVMAIKIQREVGGNLAELLLTVSNTMTQRERLRRDVNTLTAEGRMSAIVLGLLPPGLGAVMFAMNPDYIKKLFEGGLGIGMLVLALVAMGVGFAWMQKIIKIEV